MTRAVVTAFAAVVLGLTATPAHARPLHGEDGRVEPTRPCARIVIGAPMDCLVHVKCGRVKANHHGHHGHKGRKCHPRSEW